MASAVFGCSQYGPTAGLNRAEPLGMQRTDPVGTQTDPAALASLPMLPPLALPAPSSPESYQRQYRDSFVEQWMARSDILCRQYKDKLILVSRDTRFATDASTTLLSGLATIFKSLSVVHPLTGASTIIGGVGAAADADFFQRQSGEIIASAIQTAREAQANQIEKNLREKSPLEYNIYRAQRDVTEYHNMCSLETGLAQIRASLRATSPDQGITPPAAQGEQQLGLTIQPPPPPLPPPPAPPPPVTRSGRTQVTVTVPLARHIEGAIGPDEMAIDPATGIRIEAALCTIPDRDRVTFGRRVRDAIELYRGSAIGRSLRPRGATAAGAGLRRQEIGFLNSVAPCQTACYSNAFEYFEYGPPADRQRAGAQRDHLKALHDVLVPNRKDETFAGFCDPGVRSTIDAALARLGRPAGSGLSRDVMLKLEAETARSEPPIPLPPAAPLPVPGAPAAVTPAPAPPPPPMAPAPLTPR